MKAKTEKPAKPAGHRKVAVPGKGGPPVSLSAASAEFQANRLLAAQEEVKSALVELLDRYDPFDERMFSYGVAQALNLIGRVDDVAMIIGASPATVHRWASGASIPLPLMRAAIAALLREILLRGIDIVLRDRTAFIKAASEVAQAKLTGAFVTAEQALDTEPAK